MNYDCYSDEYTGMFIYADGKDRGPVHVFGFRGHIEL